jgi:competence protein ComFB
MKQLHNIMEVLAKDYISQHLSKHGGICTCEDCQLDIMAIILNKMKPHYVVSDTGAMYAKAKNFDFQPNVDLAIAMAEAMEIVKSRPRHDPPEGK